MQYTKTERISESAEQQAVIEWTTWASARYPCLKLLYHIPNGGSRGRAEAGRFKSEGVKAGVPDLCLPAARHGYHGLYIEMKAMGGKVSGKQTEWIKALEGEGYLCRVCYGADAAIRLIEAYLKEDRA